MRVKFIVLAVVGVALAGGGWAYRDRLSAMLGQPVAVAPVASPKVTQGISVTVTHATLGEMVETAFVNGTLVAREEILVGPEIEGLRVTEVLADEGDQVKKGQVLARLVPTPHRSGRPELRASSTPDAPKPAPSSPDRLRRPEPP